MTPFNRIVELRFNYGVFTWNMIRARLPADIDVTEDTLKDSSKMNALLDRLATSFSPFA
jgi:hypothetical protein